MSNADGFDDPNPFDDPGLFGFVWIDDVLIETTLVSIDGAVKPEDWQVTKGAKSGGATAAWKGTKLAEKIKIKFRSTDGPSYAAQQALYRMLRPKLGQKPPTVNIANAIVNQGGIFKVRLVEPAEPKWIADKRAWEWEWELGEHAPSKEAATGASDPAKPESAAAGGKQSPAEKELQDLLKEARSL